MEENGKYEGFGNPAREEGRGQLLGNLYGVSRHYEPPAKGIIPGTVVYFNRPFSGEGRRALATLDK